MCICWCEYIGLCVCMCMSGTNYGNLWDRPLVSRSQSPPCLALVDNKRSGPAPRSARTTKTEQRAARPREALLALGPPQLSKSASMSSLVETSTAENSSRGTKAALFLLSPPGCRSGAAAGNLSVSQPTWAPLGCGAPARPSCPAGVGGSWGQIIYSRGKAGPLARRPHANVFY